MVGNPLEPMEKRIFALPLEAFDGPEGPQKDLLYHIFSVRPSFQLLTHPGGNN